MEAIQVVYCGVCTLPIEYCEFTSTYEKCKKWQQENGITNDDELAESVDKLSVSNTTAKSTTESKDSKDSKDAKSDVKLLPGGKIKKKEAPSVTIVRTQRNKRKFVTTVTGLDTFGIKLADASKLFAKKFSCGASVVKNPSLVDEIDIQGDVKEDLADFIVEKWPQINDSSIFFVDEGKKNGR